MVRRIVAAVLGSFVAACGGKSATAGGDAGQSPDAASADKKLGEGGTHGTVVHFGAQATVLNGGCTNGKALQWDFTLP
jgi:hypothetical protein